MSVDGTVDFMMQVNAPEVTEQDMERWNELADVQHVHFTNITRLLIVFDHLVFSNSAIYNLAAQLTTPERRVYVLRGSFLKVDLQLWDLDKLSAPNMRIIRELLKENSKQ